MDRFDQIRFNKGDSSTGEVRTSMQKVMQEKCAVFRTDELISKGIEEFNEIENSMDNIDVIYNSIIFNTDLTASIELHN